MASPNRCTISTTGFQPSSFLLGPPSVKRPNICEINLKSISLFDNFQNNIQTDIEQAYLGQDDSASGVNNVDIQFCSAEQGSPALVNSLDVDKMETAVQTDLESLSPVDSQNNEIIGGTLGAAVRYGRGIRPFFGYRHQSQGSCG